MSSKTFMRQYAPLTTPSGWNGEEKRFVRQLCDALDDIYKRYGRLELSDLNSVVRSTVSGLENGVASNQQSVNTLGEALALLSSAKLDKTALLDGVYPVGSLYLSVSAANPATLFGGTWERLKDRFLLGAGDTYAAGATGGEATHTLTTAEMPSHTHRTRVLYDQSGFGYTSNTYEIYLKKLTDSDYFASTGGESGTLTDVNTRNLRPTVSTGGNAAHNNLPPYLAVYIWKRTA